jgi:hypothetical protein
MRSKIHKKMAAGRLRVPSLIKLAQAWKRSRLKKDDPAQEKETNADLASVQKKGRRVSLQSRSKVSGRTICGFPQKVNFFARVIARR